MERPTPVGGWKLQVVLCGAAVAAVLAIGGLPGSLGSGGAARAAEPAAKAAADKAAADKAAADKAAADKAAAAKAAADKAAADKAAAEKARLEEKKRADEQKRLEAEKRKEAERLRIEEERKKREEARRKQEEEQRRLQEERRLKELERQALEVLNDAKRSYDQKNYNRAIGRYREFLAQHAKRPEATAARFGLAMAIIDNPEGRDWSAAATELQQVIEAGDLPDRGRAHYWLGVSLRVTGEQMLEAARQAKGDQQKDQLAKANDRLAQAVHHYTTAETVLAAGVNPPPAPDAKDLPAALEQAAAARAECAETLLKAGRLPEAIKVAGPFLSDRLLARSAHRPAGVLVLGRAQFELKDYPAAFATLAALAPFDQPGVGLHARFLLGRIKQATGEKPEAVRDYAPIAEAFLKQRRAAEEALRNRAAWAGRPIEQQRLEALVRAVPEYVLGAGYYAGLIQFDYGQYGEAASRFQGFLQAAPRSELSGEVQMKLGMCLVYTKSPEAPRVLRQLADDAQFAQYKDQATWWLGKFLANPAETDPGQRRQRLTQAVPVLTKAAELAQAAAATDPAAKARRMDILLDLADAHAALGQLKEAIPHYQAVAEDASNPERAQIAHERWAMALNKSGDYTGSEQVCARFLEKYPRGQLVSSVLFWQAENSYRQGLELAKKPETAEQGKKMQQQAAARYEAVVQKYPEFPYAGAARFGVGMANYRQGEYEKAAKLLSGVPEPERAGEMALTSYYQSDCLLRTLPEGGDDALSAARLSNQLEQVCALLSGFVGGAGNDALPEMPDAMLKLADSYQRAAALIADQQERQRLFTSARETYEKLLQKYPRHPAFAQAVMDRARLMAAVGDVGGAINELNRFRNDNTLSKSDIAPLALIRLSAIMVPNGRAVDAAAMLEKCRREFEPALAKDPARKDVVPALQYAHGVALKESGKKAEAVALFEGIIKQWPERPEAAEASLASILVRKDEAVGRLKHAQAAVAAAPGDKPTDPKLVAARAEAVKQTTEIANALSAHADRIAEKSAGSDLHLRTLRDAAATWRAIGEAEVEAVRRDRAADALKRLQEKFAKRPAIGKSNSVPRPPEIKLAAIPLQPGEVKARELYGKAFEANADSPVCNDLRLHLADMYYERGEADPAIQLLGAAIDKNPPQPQLEFLRVKLGRACLLKKDAGQAIQLATAALQDGNHPVRPAAYLLKGMALMEQKNWGEAQSILTRFMSGAEKYMNAGHVTEEGLFRLGEAYAASNNWNESHAAFENLLRRFPHGKFAAEARYGAGWALQQTKQFDRAVEAYADVTRRTASELAAKAQYQIGLCRTEQKRWQDAVNELLAVPVTYDYAEIAAPSALEAAKALVELKQKDAAREVLQRVVHDHPQTQWATEAQKRLAQLQ